VRSSPNAHPARRRAPRRAPPIRCPPTLRLAHARAQGAPRLRATRSRSGGGRRCTPRARRHPLRSCLTVIATYRRPELLPCAIRSALAQDLEDHAVVVVDDGGGLPSTLPDDERLTTISLSRNLGVAGVTPQRRDSASRAQQYLAFLETTNEWRPDHLSRSLEAHARGASSRTPRWSACATTAPSSTCLRAVRSARGARHRLSPTPAPSSYAGARRSCSAGPRATSGSSRKRTGRSRYRLSRRLRTEHIPRPRSGTGSTPGATGPTGRSSRRAHDRDQGTRATRAPRTTVCPNDTWNHFWDRAQRGADAYRSAAPFPHGVFDSVFPDAVLQSVLDEWPAARRPVLVGARHLPRAEAGGLAPARLGPGDPCPARGGQRPTLRSTA